MMNRLLIMIFMGFAFSLPAHAAMYKWVDKQGKVHYGDTIPPEYANQGSSQLDNNGLVIKKTDAALTPEQIKARDEAAAIAKKEKEVAQRQQRRDKALLATYTDVKEIDLAAQRNMSQIDAQIKSNELPLKSAMTRLDALKKQRNGFVQRNKAVPPDLANDLKNTQDEIAHLNDNIATLEKEKAAMRDRFASDKARFMELKGLSPAAPAK